MATYTTNLNLKKPAYADPVDIADINNNMDAIDTAVAGKVNTQQAVADAGKILGIDNTGAVTPIQYDGSDFTGATSSTAGTHGYVPAPAAGDEGKVLMGDGTWKEIDADDMTGATASTAGTHGFAPAPAAGDQMKVLYGSGDWEVAPGARVVQVEMTVTNTSGAYTNTVQDERVTADMKAMSLEIANPYVFNDKITVTCNAGTVTLACSDVTGTSLVKINIMKAAMDAISVTSEEFDILDERTSKLESEIGIIVDGNKSAQGAAIDQYIILKNSTISGCDDGVYTAAKAIPANTVIDSTYLTAKSNGVANALKSEIDALGSKITNKAVRLVPRYIKQRVTLNNGYTDITLPTNSEVTASNFVCHILADAWPLSSWSGASVTMNGNSNTDTNPKDKVAVYSASAQDYLITIYSVVLIV